MPSKINNRWFIKNPPKALLLVYLSIILAILIISEVTIRIYKQEFRIINFQAHGINILKSYYPATFDKLLGYIPKEGYDNSNETVSSHKVTILQDGIRSNGNNINLNKAHQRVVILAVGDSFTFGDEVSNGETWPAYLEKITNTKVINGGVFGYAFDQIVLRSEDLIKKYKPNILIVSFIEDDLKRCGLKIRTNIPKPYYLLKNNELVLINSHLSENEIARLEQRKIVTGVLGYSLLINNIMSEYAPHYWFQGAFRYEEKSGEDYQKIAVALMARLKQIEKETSTKVIIMPQHMFNESIKNINELKYISQVAADSGLELIDLLDKIMNIKTNNYNQYVGMFIRKGHMSPQGNKWFAEELAEQLYLRNHIPQINR